jgi:beta-galactosidase
MAEKVVEHKIIRMNRYLLVTILLAWSGSVFSQRLHENFDEGWRFHFGHATDFKKDFNYNITTIFSKSGAAPGTAIDPRFNDKDWRTLNLPHDWVVELPFVDSPNFDVMAHGYKPVGGLFPETSIGWYRKHFTINRSDSGKRFQLQFDGVFRDANFWINGFYLGNNMSGYVGASYDITDYLNYDRENVVVVRVDATKYEGWFYEGAGIYRHVWLNQVNNTHIIPDGVFIHSSVSGTSSMVNVVTTITNQGLQSANSKFFIVLTDRQGRIIKKSAEEPITLDVNQQKSIVQKIALPNAHLWSLEDPYLYKAICYVTNAKKIIDSVKLNFGIRTLRIDPSEGFFLNGKHVKIKGTNNHQDHAGVGSALPDYLQYYRIRLLKDAGCNAIRTSHNAPAPELLDACDSLGILVLDEQRLLNSSPEYMSQFERLIKRDRSHPSVFLWSIGNEEGWIQTTTIGKRIAQTLLEKQKELDPTRTSTYAADVANVYKGINEVIPVRGFNYRDSFVAAYHHDHPNQPILGTEMGSTVTTRGVYQLDTAKGYLPDEDVTAPWWAALAQEWWPLAAENNYWMGGFVWTGFDYRGEPTPFKWPNINSHFGFMDVCGFPKNLYYYYQSWWKDEPVLHISPHWNWSGKEGQPIDVWVNSNAETVELFLNGNRVGTKSMPRNKHLEWKVPFTPGVLSAVGHWKGKSLETKVETTGVAAEIALAPSKTTMLADNKDAVVVNIRVMDRQGREVPVSNNLIRFSVAGDAHIIGVGNGDPSSHERDKYYDSTAERSLFNGRCQVILQAGSTPGMIKLEARSEGLQPGSTTIFSIHVPAPALRTTALTITSKQVDKMLGADISFLPQLEARGMKFSDKGVTKDAISILKDHGVNYIRLRLFNNPSTDKGYSPKQGFCDLPHTLAMAKRIKAAGMKFLLDFHYSDYWADPQQQYLPVAWKGLSFNTLKDSFYRYTKEVLVQLKRQGTLPQMVQVGNEINHGLDWPDGHIGNMNQLADLLKEGVKAIRDVDPSIIIMMHIALGGQNDESRFFLDNIINRGVPFDVIGESYYPKWHGTLDDLRNNLSDLALHYRKPVIVVEYSQLKQEVNDIAFNLPGDLGRGTCIWEPLNTWESIFDKDGKSNLFINIYDEIAKKYMSNKYLSISN